MQVRIIRLGDDLAVQVPDLLADELGLVDGQLLEVSFDGTAIRIVPGPLTGEGG